MRILALSAHADDGCGGAAGFIHRMVKENHEVYYVAFSIAEESVPKGFKKDIVETECRNATKILGIKPDRVLIYRYAVRRFPEQRQDILDRLIKLRKLINPNICLTPSSADIHQDHSVLCENTVRAFQKSASIYGYDFPWNTTYTSNLNLFYELDKNDVEKKVEALLCFKSQLEKDNNCLTPEYIRSLAIVRGNMAGMKYAEGFEIIRERKTK